MCGIIYAKNKKGKTASNEVWKQYKEQELRGQSGYGYIAIYGDGFKVERATTEVEIKAKLLQEKSSEILFHHRYPTSTPNLREMAHPIQISSRQFKYDYFIIHNGIITNSPELKLKHLGRGINYSTLMNTKYITKETQYYNYSHNDSEALGVEIALFLEGIKDEITAKGDTAFMILQAEKNGKPIAIYFGRNEGNPLNVKNTGRKLLIASEADGIEVEAHKLFKINLGSGEISARNQIVIGEVRKEKKWSSYGSYKNYGYDIDDKPEEKTENSYLYAEDEAYYFELVAQRTDLHSQIRRAVADGDYDGSESLELELQDLNQAIEDYEAERLMHK